MTDGSEQAQTRCTLGRIKFGLMLLLFPAFLSAKPVQLDLVTEEFPPLQVQVDNQAKGYVIDFIKALVDDASKEVPVAIRMIHFVPWKRALVMSQQMENVLFFSISRTEARENKYHWIGEVSPYEVKLFRHSSGPKFQPERLSDLEQFQLGTQAGGNLDDYFTGKGFELIKVTYSRRVLKLLKAGRIDYAPLISQSYYYRIEQYDLNPDDYLPVLRVDELCKDLWLVASKGTSPEVVQALRNSYQKLINQGELQQLIDAYHPKSEVMMQYRAEKRLQSED